MGDPQRPRPFWYLRRHADAVASEVDEELALHLALRTEELQAHGLSPAAARREALRQFGDLEATRRYCRRQDLDKDQRMERSLLLSDLGQDLRICLRSLRRAPLLTATIVATVGLGIGATTAIYSAVHAALFRPLPYASPESLVGIFTASPPNRFRLSVVDYLALQAEQTHFEAIAAYTERTMAWSDGTSAERLRGREVSPSYFGLLGIRSASGRDFTEADGRPGSARAVLVSHGFWQRRLGARTDAIGSILRLDGTEFTLAGVLPATLGPLERGQEFFVAARWDTPRRKGPFFLIVLGRLRSGVDLAAATDELEAINRRLFPLWRTSYQDEKATWGVLDLRTQLIGEVGTIGALALAAVGLVWLIACANASNLLIARVTSRRQELAVRAALGASRGRVVRYLLAESSLLALGAATLGAALAWASVKLLQSFGAAYFPRTQEITLGGPVLWLLAALGLASALLFGLIPAAQGTSGPVAESIRVLGRTATGTVAVSRLRRLLVGAQFAIATPLLVVAGLLLASLHELGRVDLGFDARRLLSGAIALPSALYPDPAPPADSSAPAAARSAIYWSELERRVAALPGVSGVALADGLPPNGVSNFNNFDLEESPGAAGESQPVTPWVAVTPDYFRLLGLELLDGRLLEERDGATAELETVVVDGAWARRFFPGESAVGKRFREGGCTSCPWTTVVGVVSEVRYAGLDQPHEGAVYTAMGPTAPRFRFLLLRTAGDPLTLLPAVRRVVHELDPEVPFSQVATVEELVAQSLERPRSLSLLVGSFASVALALAILGIYGVMAYSVDQQSKEIGIRLALGGDSADVLRLILSRGMRVVASGVGLGLLAALLVTRSLSRLFFGVGTADVFTFATVGGLLLTVALVACMVPARRATSVQPAAVLRGD